MRILLLFTSFIITLFANGQTGNTITDAIPLDGTTSNLNILDSGFISASGLTPACGTSEDIFYKHSPTSGDNKITIGMTSGAISVVANVQYQILKAPNGDTDNLEVVTCNSYNVTILGGGSFEILLNNINDTDDYYLRVYKMTGLGALLSSLLSGTTASMSSSYDETLSNKTSTSETLNIITQKHSLEILNNSLGYSKYQIFSIDGKRVINNSSNSNLRKIDISFLNKGLYILNLENTNNSNFTYKFVKL